MYCINCGEKTTLMYYRGEGLIPFCKKCEEFRFPQFATAVSMVVVNREKDKILLAKHRGQEDYILFAGYVKKGETAEKTVTRELKEETKLNTVKFKFMSSRYLEAKNLLMLNFLVMAENGEIELLDDEIESVEWFSIDDALKNVRDQSNAQYFLKNAISEIKKI